MLHERYINPFTDFGFKKLFGDESNKDLLIDFLNSLLFENQPQIVELTFLKTKQLGASEIDRRAIFDLYCQNERGEKFIVQLQKANQAHFKNRNLYHTTFAIQAAEQDFRLNPVYSISIMDFTFDEQANGTQFRHDVQLVDVQTNCIFYDKLRFIYLEMPKFNKAEDELETNSDKWLFVLKNLAKLQGVPPLFQERIFLKMFQTAEIAKYNPQERQAYQDSMKYYRDWKNVIDTAVDEAVTEAVAEEKTIFAKKLKNKGFAADEISELTGLSLDEVNSIR